MGSVGTNSFLPPVYNTLPRLLALFDMDRASKSYGLGDRFHWAWALIDFGNGTFQGAANGLARLVVNDLLPEGMSEASMLNRINAIFEGTAYLHRSDGSMEEAFPYEGSFCVTALVAFDLLNAVDMLDVSGKITKEQRAKYLDILRPLIVFLKDAEETHAFISNHLATGAAALIKWHYLTGENTDARGKAILDDILRMQSAEGWYLEYEGADPGYQTLCIYYLADIYEMTRDDSLLSSLKLSIEFLWHFVHPDGSLGGVYGSRNTRFYYPGGFERLAELIPEAAAMAIFMRKAIDDQHVVTLEAIDEPNLIPMFNAYCWAASCTKIYTEYPILPCQQPLSFRKVWNECGLLVDKKDNRYTIVSLKKGGVVYSFKDKTLCIRNGGVLFSDAKKYYTTQHYSNTIKIDLQDDRVLLVAPVKPITKQLPKPWQFTVLRIANISFMRLSSIREYIKRKLVKMLITGNNKNFGYNTREIIFGEEVTINDNSQTNKELIKVSDVHFFSSIHMASQGYWQKQDDI